MFNSVGVYILISFFLLYIGIKFSYKLNLLDYPNKRKVHSRPVVYTGGFIISIILLYALLKFEFIYRDLSYIISISFLIAVVGTIDDKYNLNTGGKLSLQIIPIFYLIVLHKFYLNNIGDYNYFYLNLGSFSIPFTLICVLFLINSFNYFDGADGTLSIAAISVLTILYFLINDENIKFFIQILFIPIIIFLCFNFSLFNLPKAFLGDGGSLLLGFIISFFLIFISKNQIIHPILLAWTIVIFVYEFLSLNLIRLKNNREIFKPGNDHLHHILLDKTKSIHLTNLLIFFFNIILFFIGYFSYILINSFASLFFFIIFFIIYFIFRNSSLMLNKKK